MLLSHGIPYKLQILSISACRKSTCTCEKTNMNLLMESENETARILVVPNYVTK